MEWKIEKEHDTVLSHPAFPTEAASWLFAAAAFLLQKEVESCRAVGPREKERDRQGERKNQLCVYSYCEM